MKSSVLLLIILVSIALNACQAPGQELDLDQGVSIVIPEDFTTEENFTSEVKIFKAQKQGQSIICSSIAAGFSDTLTREELTSILKLNTERYIEPFKGVKISIQSDLISDVEAFRFSFFNNRADDTYLVSGKSFIYNNRIVFISYEAVYPVESNIEKSIDSFLKSVSLD